jgi:hypothetical protein
MSKRPNQQQDSHEVYFEEEILSTTSHHWSRWSCLDRAAKSQPPVAKLFWGKVIGIYLRPEAVHLKVPNRVSLLILLLYSDWYFMRIWRLRPIENSRKFRQGSFALYYSNSNCISRCLVLLLDRSTPHFSWLCFDIEGMLGISTKVEIIPPTIPFFTRQTSFASCQDNIVIAE